MAVEILSVGSYLPKNKVTNNELASKYHVDTTDEWIKSHTGIASRYVADENESCTDMAFHASQSALERAGVKAEELDCIIFATSTPDYKVFPASSSILQDKLGAHNSASFDLSQGCSGFVYAMEVGRSMIMGGMKKVLVVGAEKLTSVINWEDRNTCVLFGDGAGVVLLSKSNNDKSYMIDSILKSEGSGHESLIVKKGGSKLPMNMGEAVTEDSFISMDGRKVYNFAVRVVSELIKELLDKHKLGADDIKYIVPHQANKRIIHASAKRLGINHDKFYVNIEEFANTSAATVPIALNELEEKGLLQKGDLIMTIGFGAGLAYGGNLLRW